MCVCVCVCVCAVFPTVSQSRIVFYGLDVPSLTSLALMEI